MLTWISQLHREKTYNFFLPSKQPDGSILATHDAEIDVLPSSYRLLRTANFFNIVTSELVAGTAESITSCQTYEDGFASAGQACFSSAAGVGENGTLLDDPCPPLGQAHGGYAFCALAWCYSWWVSGAFGLLHTLAAEGGSDASLDQRSAERVPMEEGGDGKEDEWLDDDEVLFNRQALREYMYVLSAGQHPAGGLRDKPLKCVHLPFFLRSRNSCLLTASTRP